MSTDYGYGYQEKKCTIERIGLSLYILNSQSRPVFSFQLHVCLWAHVQISCQLPSVRKSGIRSRDLNDDERMTVPLHVGYQCVELLLDVLTNYGLKYC